MVFERKHCLQELLLALVLINWKQSLPPIQIHALNLIKTIKLFNRSAKNMLYRSTAGRRGRFWYRNVSIDIPTAFPSPFVTKL